MVRLAIAISGQGSNMRALVAGMAADRRFEAPLILASRPCPGLDWAKEQGLETALLPYRQGADVAEAELDRLMTQGRVKGLLLAGFMRVLSPEFVKRHEGGVLNIHPSLLPAFKGGHALVDFWASDAKESGVTIHIVTEELDGGPILAQVPVPRQKSFEAFEEAIHQAEAKLYWPVAQAYFTR